MTGDSVAKKRKRAAKKKKKPAMKATQAWVPVDPDGLVWWSFASGGSRQLCYDGIRIWRSLRDRDMRGWSIVRCRVEG
jgi:hypothetical protein